MNNFYQKHKSLVKSTKGFTLVELIVTLAIAGIFMSVAISILASGTSMLTSQVDKDLNKNIAGNILDFMKETIQYSSEEVIVGDKIPSSMLSSNYGLVYVSDTGTSLTSKGYLYFKGKGSGNPPKEIFGPDFYNNRTIGMSVNVVDEDTMEITLQVYDSSGALIYTTKDSISLTRKAFDPGMPGISPSAGTFSPVFVMFQ